MVVNKALSLYAYNGCIDFHQQLAVHGVPYFVQCNIGNFKQSTSGTYETRMPVWHGQHYQSVISDGITLSCCDYDDDYRNDDTTVYCHRACLYFLYMTAMKTVNTFTTM